MLGKTLIGVKFLKMSPNTDPTGSSDRSNIVDPFDSLRLSHIQSVNGTLASQRLPPLREPNV